MALRINLGIRLDLEVFQIEEIHEVERLAESSNRNFYCWKTSGQSNWLEQGFSICDVLGLTLLPKGLPDYIEMADDPPEMDD